MPDAQQFRQAWSRFATGVSVITTREPDGGVHGMAANGICSVSLDPMLVLVCVDHRRQTYPLIKSTGRFAINILAGDQQAIAEYWARPPEKREGDVETPFKFTKRGAATIEGCLAYMDCHVYQEVPAGDHTLFIGEVDEIHIGSAEEPLLFYQSKFNQLDSSSFSRTAREACLPAARTLCPGQSG
ncbi:MAG: flavin reductase family protein [SAR202 cluster bacterium]|nr:flavin reductase family protein [SAR202 cluster bacterium]